MLRHRSQEVDVRLYCNNEFSMEFFLRAAQAAEAKPGKVQPASTVMSATTAFIFLAASLVLNVVALTITNELKLARTISSRRLIGAVLPKAAGVQDSLNRWNLVFHASTSENV